MAIDLFSLVGKISVEYSDAVKNIESVSDTADDAARSLGAVDDAADDAAVAVDGAGDSADYADGEFSTWKVTLANLASQAITALIDKCSELADNIVNLGIDTETAFAQLETISGTENIDSLKKSISELSQETGVSSSELAVVAYNAISAGASASEASEMVEAATKLATAGFTDADSALSVLSTAMNSYGDAAGTATEISDSLIMVQNLGVTTIGSLSSAMGKAIATGSAYGVSLGNIESGYVSLTKAGISTEESTTYLNSMMNELGDTGSDVAAVIQEQTGQSFADLMNNGSSLSDVLGILYDSVDGDSTALMNLWSSAEAGKASNAIVNQGLEQFNENLNTIENSTGATETAYATMSDTTQHKIDVMKTNFEELGLKIYDGLEGPLNSAVGFITDTFIPKVSELVDNIGAIASAFLTAAAGIGVFTLVLNFSSIISTGVGVLTSLKTAIFGVNSVLMANPILTIVALVAGLVAALVTLWNTNEGFRDAVTEIWGGLSESFGTAIDSICTFFSNLWDTVSEIFNSIWETVQGVLDTASGFISDTFETIVGTVSGALQSVRDWFESTWDNVANSLSAAWNTICNVVQVGIMFIGEILNAAFQIITLPFQFIWENCKEYIMAAWEAIKTAVSDALDAISTTISNIWNAIVDFLSPILDGIKTTFTNIWDAIKTKISEIMDAVHEKITEIWNTISTTVSTVMDAIKTKISNIWDAIKTKVSTVVDEIKTTVSNIFNAVKTTVTNILNSIKTKFTNIWDGIKTKVSSVITSVKTTISNGMNSAKTTVSNILDNIKNKFTNIFDSAKTIVKNAIEKIKSYFNFTWSLPSIKLPHFSIDGSFSLNPPSVPHFSVDWYKKAMEDGMIMNEPTIFGYNAKTNQFMAGGEAGSETVVGTESLMEMIRAAVSAENEALVDKFETLISILAEYFPAIIEAMSRAVVLDSGVLVGELAPALDEELGLITIRKGR